ILRTKSHAELPDWGTHENLWLAPEMSREDLEAQVALFLLQTETVVADGPVRDRLVTYLRRTFRFRGADHADAFVYEVYDHLRKNKWWSDDWRAWRKYVRSVITGLLKAQRPRAATEPDVTPDTDGLLTVDSVSACSGIPRSTLYAR